MECQSRGIISFALGTVKYDTQRGGTVVGRSWQSVVQAGLDACLIWGVRVSLWNLCKSELGLTESSFGSAIAD